MSRDNRLRFTRQQTREDFAGLDALLPRVVEVYIVNAPTVVKPSATTSATADLTGLFGSAFGAYGCACHRRCDNYQCDGDFSKEESKRSPKQRLVVSGHQGALKFHDV